MTIDPAFRAAAVDTLNRLVVSAYKLFGFAVLSVLLVGMVSFIGTNAFFFLNHTWVQPTIVSPSDDRVLALSGQLSQAFSSRDRLQADRGELTARLAAAERSVAAHEAFREEFRQVIAAEAASRREELRRLESLRAGFHGAKAQIVGAGTRYSEVSRERLEQLRAAKLVDTESYLGTAHQLMQIAQAGLSLDETDAQLEGRAIALRRDVRALDAMSHAIGEGGVPRASDQLSYDVFRMKEEFARAGVELARARAEREAIATSLEANEAALARFDHSLKGFEQSPLLQAVDARLTLAFVPYENLGAAREGAPLQACALAFVWCHRVGRIVEVVQGEVFGHHPLRNVPARGLMVRVELAEPASANERLLFAGSPPLFL